MFSISPQTHPEATEKFQVIGIITSDEFQKCRFVVNKLRKGYPNLYEPPELRPMLNMEWEEYSSKMKRKINRGDKFWTLTKAVAVFRNGEYLGDDKDLMKHILQKFRFNLNMDWYEIGKAHLLEHLREILATYRQLVYLTFAVKQEPIGSMLFMLYNDLVPLTCENFLNRCKNLVGGYSGTPVHRIVKDGWIQCGGYQMLETKIPCENYAVSHDRRGVLSMCNSRRHKHNSTQFFVTLGPSTWMDYRYVAFGQLLQGAEILRKLEQLDTYWESPMVDVTIVNTGEFTLCVDKPYTSATLGTDMDRIASIIESIVGPKPDAEDVDSNLSDSRYKLGLYAMHTDLKSYFPFAHLPDGLLMYLRDLEEVEEGADGVKTYLEYVRAPITQKDSFVRPYFSKYKNPNEGYIKSLLDSSITI